MLVEHTTTPLSDIIISKTNYTLNSEQISTIGTIVNTMQKNNSLASEMAHKICTYLKIQLQGNYQSLVDIISEYNRKKSL